MDALLVVMLSMEDKVTVIYYVALFLLGMALSQAFRD